jgi:hypothetical protein
VGKLEMTCFPDWFLLGTTMSDKELRNEAMTLFLAGYETTALTLAWTSYLLGPA